MDRIKDKIMQNYQCKNCGATLYWNVEAEKLKCLYCDSVFQPSDFEDKTLDENIPEASANETPEAEEQEYVNAKDYADDMAVYECENCGGEVVTLKTTMADICPYCGEAVSITSKAVNSFRPKLCIPFKKDKKAAMSIYKKYVERSFLTPKVFKKENTIEKMQGLFAPFYLHTIVNTSTHSLEGENRTSHRSGDDKITTHSLYDLTLKATGLFQRIPTDGAVRLPNKLMDTLEPFDYDGCKSFDPAYMAGFVAEQYDDEMETLNARAETKAQQTMTDRALSAFSYDSIKLKNESHNIIDHSSEYAMLPVWILNVVHGNKKYTYAINGQTGKIVGKLPLSKSKVAGISLGVFAAADVISALLVTMFG